MYIIMPEDGWCQDEAKSALQAPTVPTMTIVPAPRDDASPSKLSRLQNMDVLEVRQRVTQSVTQTKNKKKADGEWEGRAMILW